MTAERINSHPPIVIREGELAPSHVICKVHAINLMMVRDVSIIMSLFLTKELVLWPQLTCFNPRPSGIPPSWSEHHTLLERMPVAVRQPPAHVSLPQERLPGPNPMIRLFQNHIFSSLPPCFFFTLDTGVRRCWTYKPTNLNQGMIKRSLESE